MRDHRDEQVALLTQLLKLPVGFVELAAGALLPVQRLAELDGSLLNARFELLGVTL
jgi:hypothetical protein